jgi:hypothetical protein
MGVYLLCSKKSPGVKIILVHGEFLYSDEQFQGHHDPLVFNYIGYGSIL